MVPFIEGKIDYETIKELIERLDMNDNCLCNDVLRSYSYE